MKRCAFWCVAVLFVCAAAGTAAGQVPDDAVGSLSPIELARRPAPRLKADPDAEAAAPVNIERARFSTGRDGAVSVWEAFHGSRPDEDQAAPTDESASTILESAAPTAVGDAPLGDFFGDGDPSGGGDPFGGRDPFGGTEPFPFSERATTYPRMSATEARLRAANERMAEELLKLKLDTMLAMAEAEAAGSEIGVESAATIRGAIWRPRTIYIIWENAAFADRAYPEGRRVVRDAIRRSWMRACAMDFRFISTPENIRAAEALPYEQAGRIYVTVTTTTVGPYCNGLGNTLHGQKGGRGMVLNFGRRWTTVRNLQSMVQWTAVHEVGHSLGFAHEQNRPDAPNCRERRSGTTPTVMLTDWDKSSIMNYCLEGLYNENTPPERMLSRLDRVACAGLYGSAADRGFESAPLPDDVVPGLKPAKLHEAPPGGDDNVPQDAAANVAPAAEGQNAPAPPPEGQNAQPAQ